jgi:Fe-S-cluster containining protein
VPGVKPLTLRFACQPGCTACCEIKGSVYLSEEDLLKAARFLKLSPEEFERKYVYRTAHQIRLRKPKDRQCHFLKDGGCSIHPAKPTQCRLFPFWPEYVVSREEWRALKHRCPGIGKGELIQIGTAMEVASEMKTAYPVIYREWE